MRRPAAALAIALVATPAAAAQLDGTWGVAWDAGTDCATIVMVLRGGTYTKAMLDIGTTQGKRDIIAGTSSYRVDGDRVEIAPSVSLSRPDRPLIPMTR